MSNNVSVGFSANPNAILDSFRRIQEEARRTNRELRSIADIDFPGLEDAAAELREMQRGFQQLFAKGLRGDVPAALRGGRKAGLYDNDFVSWASNVQRQFPDQKDLIRHMKGVVAMTERMLRLNPWHAPSATIPGQPPSSPLPAPSSPLLPRMPLPDPSTPLPPTSALPGGGLRNWPRWRGTLHPAMLPHFPSWGGTLPGGGGLPNFPRWGGTLPQMPGSGGGGWGPPLPNIPPSGGGGGGGLGGLISMLPMARAVKLGLGVLGVGTGLGAISRQIGAAEEEAVGMTDLRRNVWGLNEAFADFRDTVRKTGEGLGVTFNETLRLSREYGHLSGAMGSEALAGGTREGLRMARLFGMDPSQGVGMLGRASWLGVGGASPKEQARFLAEAMASSNLGGRQADAAEAMLRFAERNASVLGDAGNVAGFRGLYAALVNSGHAGIRANAAGILGGYDEAVRAGGHAGDAGKNFIYNAMARHGVRDIFEIQYALEGGFTGTLANGRMIGPELIKALRQRYGSNEKMLLSAMSNLFGGSMHHAQGALEAFDTYREDPAALKAAIAKLEADLKQGDTGTQVRQASADLQNVLQDLLGTRLLPIASASKDFLATIAGGVNSALDYMVPGHRRERERRENMAAWEATAMQKAAGKYAGSMEHAPVLFGHQVGDAQLAELKALNEKRAIMKTMRSAEYGKYQRLVELQHGLPAGTLHGIAMAESSNGAHLVSNVGALGPYQLMPKTAAMLGVKNPMDPYESASGAAKYLKDVQARHPDWEFANVLSAYHSGEGNVGRLGPKGRAYAPTVMGHMAGAGEVSVLLRSEVVIKDPRGNVLGTVKNPPTRVTAPSGRAAQQ